MRNEIAIIQQVQQKLPPAYHARFRETMQRELDTMLAEYRAPAQVEIVSIHSLEEAGALTLPFPILVKPSIPLGGWKADYEVCHSMDELMVYLAKVTPTFERPILAQPWNPEPLGTADAATAQNPTVESDADYLESLCLMEGVVSPAACGGSIRNWAELLIKDCKTPAPPATPAAPPSTEEEVQLGNRAAGEMVDHVIRMGADRGVIPIERGVDKWEVGVWRIEADMPLVPTESLVEQAQVASVESSNPLDELPGDVTTAPIIPAAPIVPASEPPVVGAPLAAAAGSPVLPAPKKAAAAKPKPPVKKK